MRAAFLLLIILGAGCATESDLALIPPPGIDLGGRWRLNVADSDDPIRLAQAMAAGYNPGSPDQGPGGTPGGGRGGRSGSSRNGGPSLPMIAPQPVSISAAVMADLLHWPGTEVEVRQQGGTVTFNSDGDSRLYQPGAAKNAHTGKKGRRDDAPPQSGWSGKSLIVRIEPEDNQPGFDAQYSLSDDGARLVQLITLKGGRLTGFTMSRVWDRE